MTWVVLAIAVVLVVAVTAAYAAGLFSLDAMAEPARSVPSNGLPAEPTSADIGRVRFDHALRGYREEQVDDVLDVLRSRMGALESDVAVLRSNTANPADVVGRAEQAGEG